MSRAPATDGWLERWHAHPRLSLALRAGLAASAAWALALVLPGPAGEFPYYAPFGAVVATTFTLAGSVKESVQAVGSIALGGLIGSLVSLLPADSSPFAVALAVAAGVAVGGWRPLGTMGGWVPTAAIFTLVIGHGEARYVGAYAGLTLLGAVVGIGVNALLPPLPLAPAQRAIELLSAALGKDLTDLADLVESGDRPSRAEWDRRYSAVPQHRARMQSAVAEMELATRRNLRTRRYTDTIADVRRRSAVLDRLAMTTDGLADLLLRDGAEGHSPTDPVLLGDELAPKVVHALRTIADSLREHPTGGGGTEATEVQAGAVQAGTAPADDARAAVHSARQVTGRDDEQIYVDGLLVSLRRAADALR